MQRGVCIGVAHAAIVVFSLSLCSCAKDETPITEVHGQPQSGASDPSEVDHYVQSRTLRFWSSSDALDERAAVEIPANTLLGVLDQISVELNSGEKRIFAKVIILEWPKNISNHFDQRLQEQWINQIGFVDFAYLDLKPVPENQIRKLKSDIELEGESHRAMPSKSPPKPRPVQNVERNRFEYLEKFSPLGAGESVTEVFMIQNIATEMGRIYKRVCDRSQQCWNELVFESRMVAGEPEADNDTSRRSVLGQFSVLKWTKFYQDAASSYPSWYDPHYPDPPKPGASARSWTHAKHLPRVKGKKVGSTRGAFGWYTAIVGPRAHNQWTHGTIGWGEDGEKYINLARSSFINLFIDARSHGCSRFSNPAIAAVRELLTVGSKLYKIYAQERIWDSHRDRSSHDRFDWDWILTNEGVRTDGRKADAEQVRSAGVPPSRWLESGTYTIDQEATSRDGNLYQIKQNAFRGVFYVDQGLLKGYAHPSGLSVGGNSAPFPDTVRFEKSLLSL